MIGLKRMTPASEIASKSVLPSARSLFAKLISTRASFTTTPESATIPMIEVRADHADELERLLQAGETPVVEFNIENEFRVGPIELFNVVGEITGTEKPDEYVIVCGHLASWHQATGATDNGIAIQANGTNDGWQIHTNGSTNVDARPHLVVYSADLRAE